jgi:uroporphyrinogen decarboxylase
VKSAIRTPDDLDVITWRDPTDGVFAEQLDLLQRIKAGIGDAHFVQTVFSPLSVLAFLVARPESQAADLDLPSRFDRLRRRNRSAFWTPTTTTTFCRKRWTAG